MKSQALVEELIRARYSAIYVVSNEEARVLGDLRDIAASRSRDMLIWSRTKGFIKADGAVENADAIAPVDALEFTRNYESDCIFVMLDFHPFLEGIDETRKLRDVMYDFKHDKKFKKHLVLLSPIKVIPASLLVDLMCVDYDLPDREELGRDLDRMLANAPKSVDTSECTDAFRGRIVDVGLGLTADEFQNTLARSLVRKRKIDISVLLEEKEVIIKRTGVLEYYAPDHELKDLGGIDEIQTWIMDRRQNFTKEAQDFGLKYPKGVLLLGIPGTGKSACAKAFGSAWDLPLLRFDISKVFASLVGESEQNISRVIKVAEAVAPCILWLKHLTT